MKLQNVVRRVEGVLADRGDAEVAHRKDDELREEFLSWLSQGAILHTGRRANTKQISRMAFELLRTSRGSEEIKRWYA